MLRLVYFAVSLISNVCELCSYLHLFWRNIILIASPHVKKRNIIFKLRANVDVLQRLLGLP